MPAFKFRFSQGVNRARELLESGEIGKVIFARNIKNLFDPNGIMNPGKIL